MSFADFRTQPIPRRLVTLLAALLALHAVVTGWDYAHTPEAATTSRSLTVVEQIATLHTWGICFLVAGAILSLGLVARWGFAAWLGHALCTIMYAGFTIATTQAIIQMVGTPVAEAQGSLWRGVTQSLFITVAHAVLCWIRGPIPFKGGRS